MIRVLAMVVGLLSRFRTGAAAAPTIDFRMAVTGADYAFGVAKENCAITVSGTISVAGTEVSSNVVTAAASNAAVNESTVQERRRNLFTAPVYHFHPIPRPRWVVLHEELARRGTSGVLHLPAIA
jgi:hypothetical protein